jgi:transcriptional regulator with XRE-family HTH domain
MTEPLGTRLQRRRSERGLSLEQAAAGSRIRRGHLAALEASEFERLPGAAYVRGYLRAYAVFLGLDPAPLLSAYDEEAPKPAAAPIRPLDRLLPVPARALTPPLLAGSGLALLLLLFTVYSYHQYESLRAEARPSPAAAGPPPMAASPARLGVAGDTGAPSPSPLPRLVAVVVDTTDEVWLEVSVDGRPAQQSGLVFPKGSKLIYIGERVSITSGKAAATMITLDGKPVGALGSGVATRVFTPQT